MQGHIRDSGQRGGLEEVPGTEMWGAEQYRPTARRWEDGRTNQEPDEAHRGGACRVPGRKGSRVGRYLEPECY